jgi:hypothetical protein
MFAYTLLLACNSLVIPSNTAAGLASQASIPTNRVGSINPIPSLGPVNQILIATNYPCTDDPTGIATQAPIHPNSMGSTNHTLSFGMANSPLPTIGAVSIIGIHTIGTASNIALSSLLPNSPFGLATQTPSNPYDRNCQALPCENEGPCPLL